MVTCGRQPFNMLPTMAPINPFVVGISPSVAAAAAAAAAAVAAASTSNTVAATTVLTATPSTKPKIAFSIDSIVGGQQRISRPHIVSPPLSMSQCSESPEPVVRRTMYIDEPTLNINQQRGIELRNCDPPQRGVIYCRRRASLDRSPERQHCSGSISPQRRSRSRSPLTYNARDRTPSHSPNRRTSSPAPPHSPHLAAGSPPSMPTTTTIEPPNKVPILVPGIPAGLLRPLPMQAPNLNAAPPASGCPTDAGPLPSVGGSVAPPPPPHPSHIPGIHPALGPPHSATHPPPPHGAPSPHFLAAQFQMAAALAHHHHQQQQQHPGAHLPPGHPMGIFPPTPHHPHFGGPHHQLIRDSYPLYPWLLSRHGRIFPHRFPGNFLLQPFRKPKRVRTAFSPTQLLKLEHAFEGNHYVVGAERKQLAQVLSLTETQVKVWFQNRRTKHKRMQQEDGDTKSNKGSQLGDGEGKNDSSQNSFEDQDEEEELDEEEIEDEDEVIDMDDYGSEMDAEEHQRIREQFQQQLQQHHQQMQQLQHREQQQSQQQQLLQQHQQHQHFMQQQQQYFMQQQQQQQPPQKPPQPQ